MFFQFVISGLYITAVCLCIRFVPAFVEWFNIADKTGDDKITYLHSALFATFMMAITWNGFNARTEHVNVFEHLGRNKNFLIVMGALFVAQFIFVTFGGAPLAVEPLNWQTWLICLGLSFLVIPIDIIRKLCSGKN